MKPKKEKRTARKGMQAALEERKSKLRNRWFILIIILFTFVLYTNTIDNWYNLDDSYITMVPYKETVENKVIAKGIESIPEIFTSFYVSEGGMNYGYRPLVKLSFALEYEIFGQISQLPYIGHFINVLLYLIGILILFRVLKKLLKDYSPWLPFIITLLYMAHPMHTEVVASLKNRDEILNLIFSLLALSQFISWARIGKVKYAVFGTLLFFLAILSKSTALAFLLFIPLALYFFTDIKTKKLLYFSGVIVVLAIAMAAIPLLVLDTSRVFRFSENPLIEEGFFTRFSTGMYVLLLYLKKLIYPYPMLFYYGYNTIAVKSFANVWVIFSVLLHLGMLWYAIRKFREKHILSFAILAYFVTIGMFTNIVMPVPGIIADRFLWFPSLPFAIALGYGLFRLFRAKIKEPQQVRRRLIGIMSAVILILVPYTALTIDRNDDWRTDYELYLHDIQYLENSVKANDMLAATIIRQINILIASEKVNVVDLQMPQIERAAKHFKKALEIYPEHYSSYYNLGFIYTEYMKDYEKAVNMFQNALTYCPSDSLRQCVLSNYYLGKTYERLDRHDSAFYYFEQSHMLNPNDIRPMASAVDLYYELGNIEKGVELNELMKRYHPDSYIPYVIEGRHYLLMRDTARSQRALKKGTEIGNFQNPYWMLFEYYRSKRDWENASRFYSRAIKEGRTQEFDPSRLQN